MKQSPLYLKVIHNQEIHLVNITNMNTIAQLKSTIEQAFPNNRLQRDEYFMRVATFHGWKDVQRDQDMLMLKDRDSITKVKLYIVEKEHKDKQTIMKRQDKNQVKQQVKVQQPRENNNSISMESILHKAQEHELQQFRSAVQQVQPNAQQNMVEHQLPLFTCSSCEQKYMQGTFYRCSVCPDIQLCPSCESICEHDHPLVKIKNPAHANVKIFAILQTSIEQLKQQHNAQNQMQMKAKQQDINAPIKINGQVNNKDEQKKNPSGIFHKLASLKNQYLSGLLNFYQHKDASQDPIKQKQNKANQINIDGPKYETKHIGEMSIVENKQQINPVSQQFVSNDSLEQKGGEYMVQIQDEVEVQVEFKKVRKHRIFQQQSR